MQTFIKTYKLAPLEKFLTYHMRGENPSIKRVQLLEVSPFKHFGLIPSIKLAITFYNNAPSTHVYCLQEESEIAYNTSHIDTGPNGV